MNARSGDLRLCSKCVTTPKFAGWIKQNGKRGKCDFNPDHGRRNHAVSVEAFAEIVDEFFREHFQLGREESYVTEESDNVGYRQRGSSLLEILSEELGSGDDEVVKAIIENLPDVSNREISKGADPFYDSSAGYESVAEVKAQEKADQEEYWYQNRFTYQWDDFCKTVQYERRFFKIKELLDDLFGAPAEYEGRGKTNPVYDLVAGRKIYRARVLDEAFTATVLGRDPTVELAAPPKPRARAGRMNVEFIPVFYGAFSEGTAVAEMRPGIGEEIAIGEFVLRRAIRVFDFTAFSRAPDEYRSDNYKHTRYEFIKQMEDQISRPVLPYEKQRQYIPTQIVAEYLKEYFRCEGVIYRSAMVRDYAAENRNIVLLPRPESFVGDHTSVLGYEKFVVKEVLDVSYKLLPNPF